MIFSLKTFLHLLYQRISLFFQLLTLLQKLVILQKWRNPFSPKRHWDQTSMLGIKWLNTGVESTYRADILQIHHIQLDFWVFFIVPGRFERSLNKHEFSASDRTFCISTSFCMFYLFLFYDYFYFILYLLLILFYFSQFFFFMFMFILVLFYW